VTLVTQTDIGSWEWLKDAPALVLFVLVVVVFLWFMSKMNTRNQEAHEKAQSGFADAMQLASADLKKAVTAISDEHRGSSAKLVSSIDRHTDSVRRMELKLTETCAHLNGGRQPPPAAPAAAAGG